MTRYTILVVSNHTILVFTQVYLQAPEELLVIALLLQLVMCALSQESASYGYIVGHFI